MSEDTPPAPNQLEVNKVVRVLNGKVQKYTVHLLMKDGTEKQIQTMTLPKLDFCTEARAIMLVTTAKDGYSSVPIARFDDVDILQFEENPE